jgi:hypothetical protein
VLYVAITIVRYVSDSYPGFVECHLSDAFGEQHVFIDKVPVITTADLGPESAYPQPGFIVSAME